MTGSWQGKRHLPTVAPTLGLTQSKAHKLSNKAHTRQPNKLFAPAKQVPTEPTNLKGATPKGKGLCMAAIVDNQGCQQASTGPPARACELRKP